MFTPYLFLFPFLLFIIFTFALIWHLLFHFVTPAPSLYLSISLSPFPSSRHPLGLPLSDRRWNQVKKFCPDCNEPLPPYLQRHSTWKKGAVLCLCVGVCASVVCVACCWLFCLEQSWICPLLLWWIADGIHPTMHNDLHSDSVGRRCVCLCLCVCVHVSFSIRCVKEPGH